MADTKIYDFPDGNPLTGIERLPMATLLGNPGCSVDDIAAYVFGLENPDAVKVYAATTAALTGTWVYNNGASGVGATYTKSTNGVFQAVDGKTQIIGKKYLLKNEVDQKNNGVWILTTSAAGSQAVLTRATDSDTDTELDSQVVFVIYGTTLHGKVFTQQTGNPTIGTDNIIYSSAPSPAANNPIYLQGFGVPSNSLGKNGRIYMDITTAYPDFYQKASGAWGLIYSLKPVNTIITAADLYALAFNGLMIPLEWFTINDAAFGTAVITIQARTAYELFPTGVGEYQNGVMSAPVVFTIGYNLVNDAINLLEKYSYNNLEIRVTNVDNDGIDSLNFSGGAINYIDLVDPITFQVDPTATFYRVTAQTACHFNMSAGCSISKASFGYESIVTIQDNGGGTSSVIGGNYGNNSTLILFDDHHFTNCTLGPGLTIDLTTIPAGFSATGDSYTALGSTFKCDQILNISGLTQIDVTNVAGADYSFCRYYTVETPDSDATIDHFISNDNTNDRRVTIYCRPSGSVLIFTPGQLLTKGGANITPSTNGDMIELFYNADGSVTKWCEYNTFLQNSIFFSGPVDATILATQTLNFNSGIATDLT